MSQTYNMPPAPEIYPGVRDYWQAVTDVPCPACKGKGGMIRWYEAGFVPGWRRCDGCGRHFQADGNSLSPTLVEQEI